MKTLLKIIGALILGLMASAAILITFPLLLLCVGVRIIGGMASKNQLKLKNVNNFLKNLKHNYWYSEDKKLTFHFETIKRTTGSNRHRRWLLP